MFGHQKDAISQDQQTDANVTLPDSALHALTNASTDQPAQDITQDTSTTVSNQSVSNTTDGFIPPDPHPLLAEYTDDHQEAPESEPTTAPEQPSEAPAEESLSPDYKEDEPTDLSANTIEDQATSAPASDLLKIKQDALQSLSPLVHTLDLQAEDRFRTLMMLIQASDDQSLLPEAYQAAQAIEDEKVKAQALLDVVNEINYFTQADKK